MSDLSKEFDLLFKKHGGLSHDNEMLLAEGKNIMEATLIFGNSVFESLRRTRKSLPDVYMNYIGNYSINAVAAKENNNYFIGINSGTLFLLNQLFLRMLSSPNILKEWGNSKDEILVKKIHNAQITDVPTYYIAAGSNTATLPKDPIRRHLADWLTLSAMRFLMLHEYAHIIMGHLGLVTVNANSAFYFEHSSGSKLDAMLSQTLELDADCFSCNIGISDIENIVAKPELTTKDWAQFYVDFKTALSLYVFSIYSFFRIFGMKKIDNRRLANLSHPPSGIRQSIFLSTIVTRNLDKNEDYLNMILDALLNVTNEVERAFDEISEQGFDNSTHLSAYTPEGLQHVRMIRDNWKNVRPLLEPYAFTNLSPIQDNT